MKTVSNLHSRSLSRGLVAAATLALFASLSGCAAQNHDQTAAQLKQMQRDINGLRAANVILQDRLDAMEESPRARRPAGVGDGEATPARPAAASDRPSLDVVRLGPTAAPGDEPIADNPPASASTSAADKPSSAVIRGDARGVDLVEQKAAKSL